MIDKDPRIRMSRRGEMPKDKTPEASSNVRSNVGGRLGRDAVAATTDTDSTSGLVMSRRGESGSAKSQVRSNIGQRSAEPDATPETDSLIFNASDAIHDGEVDKRWVQNLVTSIKDAGYIGVSWRDGEDTREITGLIERSKRTDLVVDQGDGKTGHIPTGRLASYFTRKIDEQRLTGTIEVPNNDA